VCGIVNIKRSGSGCESGSGVWVAFESGANNLVANDTYLQGNEIFIADSCVDDQPGPILCVEIQVASLANTGLQPTAGASGQVDLNYDGNRLVFTSNSNLITGFGTIGGGAFGNSHIWLRDRSSETTELVSVNDNGDLATGDSFYPRISRNGRFVVFNSTAGNLVANGISQPQVYVRDTCFGGQSGCAPSTTLVSVNSAGDPQAGGTFVYKSDISDDGRYVVFDSNAPNLVPGNNTNNNVYLHDRTAGTTTSICGAPLACLEPSLSGDGRLVSFGQSGQVYVRDTCIGIGGSCVPNNFLVSRQIGGVGANDISDHARISGDGFYVVFGSTATNLVATGNNNFKHVYRAITR
jgi:Tol biopolymer transport system component